MGFWKTVWAGVAVVVLTKVLEASADYFPAWLNWLGAAARWVWDLLSYMAPVPLIVALPIAAAIYKLLSINMELRKAAEQKERAQLRKEAAEREKAIKLSAAELAVIDGLIHCERPIEIYSLLDHTGLSDLRLHDAMVKLANRGLIDGYSRLGRNSHYGLSEAGTAYVVENNLDRKSRN